ncbi:DUF4430 domain-containing protein [Clostridium tetanomorphum]|uniref:DUF4430 domain-containing protein n=1 Tax=Clostridium tetanomorphum TaxID=1553 RepID=UPI000DD0B02A|nr:DUF4430 domain-containing protein [Clostridium tetanomorphum]
MPKDENKKNIMIACIVILVISVGGLFIKNYKTNNSSSASTRVIENDSGKNDNSLDKDKNTVNNTNKKKENEKNKKETKKKEEEKKKEEVKKKEQEKKNKEDKNNESTSSKLVSSNDNSGNKEVGNKVTVNIRIEGYDRTLVPRTQITTGIFDLNKYSGPATGASATPSKGWGIDKFKEPTNAHAVVKVLEKYGFKHVKDYDLQDYGWSLYIAMIGGDREFDHRSTSGWMYRVNNVLPNVGCQGKPIKNGDEILWYFGAYGFDTLATEIKANATNVKVGQPVTITLNGIKNDINTWKEFREPAKGATIYADSSPLIIGGKKFITDNNGKATIKFDKAGTYRLSAERINNKGLKDIVRPQPISISVK